MQTLSIMSLGIKNFKGIKSLKLDPGGRSIQLSGANGTGKTSIQDSFTWLLFGKDSNDRADFQLKPVGPDGQEIHNLDTEVTATLDLSGDQITLKKRFSEKWVKKRGQSRPEFTGHTTDHFIGDVPVKKKEFDAHVSEIADPGVFKLVTSPAEFNRLHWQDRRNILIDMCGDVSDEDVIGDNANLKPLAACLGKRTIEEHMKAVKAQQREINKELEQIPVRIDELSASLAEIQEPDLKEKARLEKELAAQKEKLDSVRNNERLSQKRVEANEIRAQIQDVRHQAKTGIDDESARIIAEINKLQTRKQKLKNEAEQLAHDIDRDQKRNGTAMEAMERLRQQWHEVHGRETKTDDTCPACGQELPADQIEAAREKANQIKARELAGINAEGGELKKAVEARMDDIKGAQARLQDAKDEIRMIQAEISALEEQMPEEPVADTKELDKKLALVMSEIDALENGKGIQEDNILETIKTIERKLSVIAEAEAAVKASEKTRARIAELEQQEKKLAEQYEQLAHQVFLAEQLIIKKVELLEDRINGRFEMATFKLFKEHINGGVEPWCETLHKGVPFNGGLNNAARINTGIDICNVIAEYYGFRGPIFVDNSEAVNQLIKTPAQVIAMAVTDEPELNFEIMEEKEEVAA